MALPYIGLWSPNFLHRNLKPDACRLRKWPDATLSQNAKGARQPSSCRADPIA